MCISYWQEFLGDSKRILLLQGPIGPYFYQFGSFLQQQKKIVYKLNFNGGDSLYYPLDDRTYIYTNPLDDFYDYVSEFVQKHKIDTIVCFGHKRSYHIIAKKLCLEQRDRMTFWAFEEGYLRPYYVTFEKWGVNNSSKLPREAQYYLDNSQNTLKHHEPRPIISKFFLRAWIASHYYMSMYFHRSLFPHYVHHREGRIWNYIGAWSLSAWRKLAYKPKECFLAKSIESGKFPEFFIVPLQVHDDSQVKRFGNIKNIPGFIRQVISSFAKSADKTDHLILKHHPMDRGFNHYGTLIEKLTLRYGVADRVHYVFDVPLPVFLRKAKGMVVINSTSGLSALLHNVPVKTLGKAPYDFIRMTDKQPLSKFWHDPQKPEYRVFHSYKSYLLQKTQLNTCFYSGNTHEDFQRCDLSNTRIQ